MTDDDPPKETFLPTPDAPVTLAHSLVNADQRGIHSHGTAHLPDYVRKLLRGGVDPKGEPRLTLDAGAALKIDCGNAMGQIGMAFAMELIVARAATTGVAFAAVGGSNHCGALYYFARMALKHHMIGLCSTNSIPTMAPVGGLDKVVGLSPLCIAIPGSKDNFVLDTSFGETARGRIAVYAQKGQPLPDGWACDAEGRPTTDAKTALRGLICPIGGHKGVGLGMAMGMVSSLLSGSSYGTELGDLTNGARPGRDGHFCMAIDISKFEPVDEVRSRVDSILAEVRGGRRAGGVDRLYTPGETSEALECEYARDGIPLNDETIQNILRSAKDVGADATVLAQLARRSD